MSVWNAATSDALKRIDEQARELEAERARIMAEIAAEFDREIEPALPAIMKRARWVLETAPEWEPNCVLDALGVAWAAILDTHRGRIPAHVRHRAARILVEKAPDIARRARQ